MSQRSKGVIEKRWQLQRSCCVPKKRCADAEEMNCYKQTVTVKTVTLNPLVQFDLDCSHSFLILSITVVELKKKEEKENIILRVLPSSHFYALYDNFREALKWKVWVALTAPLVDMLVITGGRHLK